MRTSVGGGGRSHGDRDRFRNARGARDVRDIRDVRDVRDVREVRDVRDVRDVTDVRDVRDVRDGRDYTGDKPRDSDGDRDRDRVCSYYRSRRRCPFHEQGKCRYRHSFEGEVNAHTAAARTRTRTPYEPPLDSSPYTTTLPRPATAVASAVNADAAAVTALTRSLSGLVISGQEESTMGNQHPEELGAQRTKVRGPFRLSSSNGSNNDTDRPASAGSPAHASTVADLDALQLPPEPPTHSSLSASAPAPAPAPALASKKSVPTTPVKMASIKSVVVTPSTASVPGSAARTHPETPCRYAHLLHLLPPAPPGRTPRKVPKSKPVPIFCGGVKRQSQYCYAF
jgi:hypothetical protein